MHDFESGDLIIAVEERIDAVTLRWRGKSTDRQPGRRLDPFFETALAEALHRKTGLELRFEKLQYFNSSTVGCLIKMIQDARTVGVKLVLVYDSRIAWQRLSFDALRVFTKDNSFFELRTVKDHEQAAV